MEHWKKQAILHPFKYIKHRMQERLVNDWLGETPEGKRFMFREHVMRMEFCEGCKKCSQYDYKGGRELQWCDAVKHGIWY